MFYFELLSKINVMFNVLIQIIHHKKEMMQAAPDEVKR